MLAEQLVAESDDEELVELVLLIDDEGLLAELDALMLLVESAIHNPLSTDSDLQHAKKNQVAA